MSLIRWQPIDDAVALRQQMDHLFDTFLGGKSLVSTKGQWIPTVDETETDDEILVKVELPGVDEKNISVKLAGNTLTVKGERESEKEEKGKHFHRMERHYGSFERSLVLPASVEPDKVKADFKKGVLEVHLPKKPESKSKDIAVNVSKQ